MWPLWLWIPGWFLTVLIVIGNGFVIYLIWARKSLHTKTNWFVLSLALADFCFGATYFPLSAACNIDQLCANGVARLSIVIFFIYASVTNLCTLTLDRFLAITKPFRYLTFMSAKRIVFLIAVAWSVPVLLFLIPYLAWKLATTGEPNEVLSQCFWSFLMVIEMLVFAALFSATLQMFLIARRYERQNFALITQLRFNHRMEYDRTFLKRTNEAASTKVILTVMTVFLIFSLADIYHNSCNFFKLCTYSETRSHVITLLTLTNSSINPVAYALFKKDFKKELKRMFCCHRRW